MGYINGQRSWPSPHPAEASTEVGRLGSASAFGAVSDGGGAIDNVDSGDSDRGRVLISSSSLIVAERQRDSD